LKTAVDEGLQLWLIHEVYFSKHICLVLILITTCRMRKRWIEQSLNWDIRFTKHGVILGYVLQEIAVKEVKLSRRLRCKQ